MMKDQKLWTWHILAGVRNPGFFWFYFVNEHFLRFLGKRYPKDYNKLPALLYWSLHLAWLFPWSMYLPLALSNPLRRPSSSANPHPSRQNLALRMGHPNGHPNFSSRTRLLCWVWAGVVLVFFSVSTNQEYYTFPAYIPLLLLLAGAVAQAEESSGSKRWLVGSTAAITALSLAAGYVSGSELGTHGEHAGGGKAEAAASKPAGGVKMCEEHGLPDAPPTLRILDRGAHGWVEHVEAATLGSDAAAFSCPIRRREKRPWTTRPLIPLIPLILTNRMMRFPANLQGISTASTTQGNGRNGTRNSRCAIASSRFSVARSLPLSRWCRPIDGSSRM